MVLEKDGEISWTDHVRNEEVLLRVNEQRNILHEIIKQKAKWILMEFSPFVPNLNLAVTSPGFMPNSGFWASNVSSKPSTDMSWGMLRMINLGFLNIGTLASSASPRVVNICAQQIRFICTSYFDKNPAVSQ